LNWTAAGCGVVREEASSARGKSYTRFKSSSTSLRRRKTLSHSLESNNNIPVIPGRKNRKQPIIYDKVMYKIRRKIEMLFGKIKENRRLAMRFDKADVAFLGFIALAIIKIIIS
jgi:hypothetical protein